MPSRAWRLTVEDDGHGFTVDPVGRAHGGRWGVLGMRERAERIGAPLAIRSAEGAGNDGRAVGSDRPDPRGPAGCGAETPTSAHPDARIVALTSYEGDADIYRALDAGARGYLLKDMLGTEVIRTIRTVAAGKRVIPAEVASRLAEFTARVNLTSRELEVLSLAAKGMRNREIAGEIGRTEATVKEHLKHVMAKLGADDRTEAVTLALQRGIIHLD